MSPREVLEKHSSRELTEWMAFMQVEPFGEERADLRAGIVASTIANVVRKKGGKMAKPEDFMPKFNVKKEEQTIEEQLNVVKMLNAALGGEVIGRG